MQRIYFNMENITIDNETDVVFIMGHGRPQTRAQVEFQILIEQRVIAVEKIKPGNWQRFDMLPIINEIYELMQQKEYNGRKVRYITKINGNLAKIVDEKEIKNRIWKRIIRKKAYNKKQRARYQTSIELSSTVSQHFIDNEKNIMIKKPIIPDQLKRYEVNVNSNTSDSKKLTKESNNNTSNTSNISKDKKRIRCDEELVTDSISTKIFKSSSNNETKTNKDDKTTNEINILKGNHTNNESRNSNNYDKSIKKIIPTTNNPTVLEKDTNIETKTNKVNKTTNEINNLKGNDTDKESGNSNNCDTSTKQIIKTKNNRTLLETDTNIETKTNKEDKTTSEINILKRKDTNRDSRILNNYDMSTKQVIQTKKNPIVLEEDTTGTTLKVVFKLSEVSNFDKNDKKKSTLTQMTMRPLPNN